MTQFLLIVWVWAISGGVALYLFCDEMPENLDILSALLMLLAWPWWVNHQLKVQRHKAEQQKLIPIRIDVKDHQPRK